MDLLSRILLFLRRSGMRTTTFGRLAANDPRLVEDLLRGREPRTSTAVRIHAWLDTRGAAR